MAQFQASGTIQLSGTSLVVADTSNYETNDQSTTHSLALFDFRLFEIIRPVDGAKFIIGTSNGSGLIDNLDIDQVAQIPSIGPNTWTVSESENFYVVNGQYLLRGYIVPSWKAGASYEEGDLVMYQGNFHLCVSTPIAPSAEPDGEAWQMVSFDDLYTSGGYYNSYKFDTFVSANALVQNTIYFDVTLNTGTQDDVMISTGNTGILAFSHSNYDTNDENGHKPSFFSHWRKLVVTRPNGNKFVLGTSVVTDRDGDLQAHNVSDQMLYSFLSDDTDGVWELKFIEFPTWQEDVYYNSMTSTAPVIVYYAGKLWKAAGDNLNQVPGISGEWVEYTTDEDDETRYSYTALVGTEFMKFLPCFNKKMLKASSVIEKNPCSNEDLCSNEEFVESYKTFVELSAFRYAICTGDWEKAKSAASALSEICCCDDCI